MPKVNVKFRFLSPWHMGSGFGEGAHLDAMPVKTAAGLPYIPGRSVKGLLREAVMLAEECSQVAAGTTNMLFGSRDPEQSRYASKPGALRVTSATLDEAMEAWAGKNKGAVSSLYTVLAATKIDGDGLADDKTLRKVEAAWPVTLTAEVECLESDVDWLKPLRIAAPLIRQAGVRRHRGLGRVEVSIEEVRG